MVEGVWARLVDWCLVGLVLVGMGLRGFGEFRFECWAISRA